MRAAVVKTDNINDDNKLLMLYFCQMRPLVLSVEGDSIFLSATKLFFPKFKCTHFNVRSLRTFPTRFQLNRNKPSDTRSGHMLKNNFTLGKGQCMKHC